VRDLDRLKLTFEQIQEFSLTVFDNEIPFDEAEIEIELGKHYLLHISYDHTFKATLRLAPGELNADQDIIFNNLSDLIMDSLKVVVNDNNNSHQIGTAAIKQAVAKLDPAIAKTTSWRTGSLN
jgi:hypothetical protein